MNGSAYQLLALGVRYLFIAILAVVVLRAGLSLLGEHNRRKKRLRSLPDAGMVGEMRDLNSDSSYPLPREGVLGSGRGCDIRLPGLRRRHANFAFVDGKGLLITPCHHRGALLLDGQDVRRGGYALHGACLQAGNYQLRIRLFAGLKAPRRAQYAETWQPAGSEELYAPDYSQMTLVQPMNTEYPPAFYGEEPAQTYEPAPQRYMPPPPQPAPHQYAPAPQYPPVPPVQEAEEDDMPPPFVPVSYENDSARPSPQPYYAPPQYPPQQFVPQDVPEDDELPPPFEQSMYAQQIDQEDPLPDLQRVRHRRSERNRRV